MKRRHFFATAPAATAAGISGSLSAEERSGLKETPAAEISFGVVTDVHYAAIPPRGTRHYSLSLDKLRQALKTFRSRPLAFIIELGDFIDADPDKRNDLAYLQATREVFETFPGPRYYVLGNHCVWILGKEAFLTGCGMERSWYSFDFGPCHGVVLDGCFTNDGLPYRPGEFDWKDSWIPDEELRWLADDLAQAKGRTVLVFVHQNLHDETRPCGIKNAPAVRRVLEEAGNVLAVFQGHEHPGAYAQIGGIHYLTMRGMIEGADLGSNAYGIVTVTGKDHFRVEGFGQQPNVTIRE